MMRAMMFAAVVAGVVAGSAAAEGQFPVLSAAESERWHETTVKLRATCMSMMYAGINYDLRGCEATGWTVLTYMQDHFFEVFGRSPEAHSIAELVLVVCLRTEIAGASKAKLCLAR